jgi:hypothetical protein
MTAINIKAQSCNNNDCIKNEKKMTKMITSKIKIL